MDPSQSTLKRELAALVDQTVRASGAELVDFELAGSERKPLLRAFVEIPGGTTAEACARLSRRIEDRLETAGAVGDRYTLEVSSPGLDRPLRSRRDFARFVGRKVRVVTQDVGGHGRELVGEVTAVGDSAGAAGVGEAREHHPEDGGSFWIELAPERGPSRVRLASDEIASAKPVLPW